MRDETGQVTIDYWGASLPPARQADELTDGQRELLTAMAAYEPLWERPSNMLELFGLPSERAALRGLLAHGGER